MATKRRGAPSFQAWSERVERKLTASGWTRLGGGLYSEVYGKGNLAIKISNGNDDWEQYVIWATKAGYAGTFAPRVHCLHRYEYGVLALMERLDCTANSAPEEIKKAVSGLWQGSAPILDATYPGWGAFFDAARGAGYANDMHCGNVMLQNATHRLVLTDPSSRLSKSAARKWRAVGNAVFTRDGKTL